MRSFIIILFILSLGSCTSNSSKIKNDKLLAETFGKKLYLSDIAPSLSENMNSKDSLFIITREVENWAMKNIIFDAAQKKIKNKSVIDKLVEDYKHSLVINEWEKTLIQENLDTTIQQEEIDTFYIQHKEEFTLPESIVRFIFIKVPDTRDSDTLKTYWKTEDLNALQHYKNISEGTAFLDVNKWYYLSTLKNILPSDLFKKINFKKPNSYSHSDKNSKFYVKVLEYVKDKSDAPVSFAQEKIRHRILQQRIKMFLSNEKSALYKSKIQNKGIKIY